MDGERGIREMKLPPSPGEMNRPGYYQEGEDGKMKHHPGFGEATRDYPGLPKLRIILISAVVLAGIVAVFLFYPRSPSPDEWATRLAQAVVVDGNTYINEPEATEARNRVLAALAAWQEDSGCHLLRGTGIRSEDRKEVQASIAGAFATAKRAVENGALGVGDFGVGYAVADRGKDYGGVVVVVDCTKPEAPPIRGPFGQ